MIFRTIVALLFSAHLALAEDIDFNKPDSYLAWIGADYSTQQQLWHSSTIVNEIPMALKRMLSGDKWVAVKWVNYAYGAAFPLQSRNIRWAQRPEKFDQTQMGGGVFVQLKSDETKHLFVQFFDYEYVLWGYGYAGIMYSKASEALAEEFQSDLSDETNIRSAYKGGVLELRRSKRFGFFEGIQAQNYKWDQIILDQKLKTDIQHSIDDFLDRYNRDTYKDLGLPMSRGILLEGPPGTGKSMIAKILSSNVLNKSYKNPVTYIHVQARHVSTSAYTIKNIYDLARQYAPTIIFIEDIDLIAGTDRTNRQSVKNELFQQLSGVEALEGVMTIATTNLASRLDPALLRSQRLGFHYAVGTPAFPERLELLKLFASKVPTASDFNFTHIANNTDGFTGADLKELTTKAIEFSFKDSPKGEMPTLNMDHFAKAVQFRKKTKLF